MSKIRVNRIENNSTANGGIDIDTSGHVKVDKLQMPTAGPLSNRSLVINGAMQVAQRGTSSTPTIGGYYTVDRFSIRNQNSYIGDVAPTYAQVEEAPAGFKYSQKVTIGTGTNPTGNDNLWLQQAIEGNNCSHLGFGTASAQTVTLSFWVRASVQGNYDVFFQNNARDRHYISQYSVSAANTWEYKTITIPGDTTGTWLTDSGLGMYVGFVSTIASGSSFATSTLNAWGSGDKRGSTTCTALGTTTGATFQITGVQLEVGEQATPFEHRSFGDELARCQRYHQKILGTSAFTLYSVGRCASGNTTNARFQIFLKQTMRSVPTLSTSGNFTVTGGSSVTGFSLTHSTAETVQLSVTTSGMTAGSCVLLNGNNDDDASISFDAEL
jgi:hypothetical protein|tara:strand:+ start:208 stop:1356 length:1149 start_codon:yes stop_codon:yes gene_type:complete